MRTAGVDLPDRVVLRWLSLLLLLAACNGTGSQPSGGPSSKAIPSGAPPVEESKSAFRKAVSTLGNGQFSATSSSGVLSPVFVDVHREKNVEFTYDTGAVGKMLMVESIGGGGGWCDFDRDAFPDLLLIQGGDPIAQPAHPNGDRWLRNLGGDRFHDVTKVCLPPEGGYGQGLAVGDYDEDGFEDVLVTNVGADVLWHNQGDGTFVDVTQTTGTGDTRWGSSAAWHDLDDDHDLDLFVCNYLDYDVRNPRLCPRPDGRPSICHPESLPPSQCEAYENLGNGKFRPVAREWGLVAAGSKSLGVVIADFNGDRRPDVFVTNDTAANHLFLQEAPGRYAERAVAMGCAYNALGQYQANMGIGCNDYDLNGHLDLYITTFTQDSNTLFANLGEAGFRDVTRLEGLHQPTLDTLGFGVVMSDLNSDGAMDMLITNGHIDDWREKQDLWKMPPEMFSYTGQGWVKHAANEAGDYFRGEYLGRALSTADYDHDGDLDVLIVHQNEPAALLENRSERGHWLHVELIGRSCPRRGEGAKVTVRQGGQKWTQQLVSGGSFCGAHESILAFGLGHSDAPCEITVHWSNERSGVTTLSAPVNRRVQIREGR